MSLPISLTQVDRLIRKRRKDISDTIPHPACTNLVLAGSPRLEWDRLEPSLTVVELKRGVILSRKPGTFHIYFPTTASVSCLYQMEDGDTLEIAVVGREGLMDKSANFGMHAPTMQYLVQSSGLAYRFATQVLDREMENFNTLYRLMKNYAQVLFHKTALTIVSKRSQPVKAQFYRRPLMRVGSADCNPIAMTHESLANMLNVRSEDISKASVNLQQEGLISYRRGHFTVIDREGLEQRAGNAIPRNSLTCRTAENLCVLAHSNMVRHKVRSKALDVMTTVMKKGSRIKEQPT